MNFQFVDKREETVFFSKQFEMYSLSRLVVEVEDFRIVQCSQWISLCPILHKTKSYQRIEHHSNVCPESTSQ
jgi:hypothetical protein